MLLRSIFVVSAVFLALPAFGQTQEEMRAQIVAQGSDYQPRTEHFEEDGSPTYVNRLIFESSPYLLQHAHNPVDWRPWGPDALAEAEATGKPIFLSIGYSTCHWCHVMERESFENESIAQQMNASYIPIKVDREQRPDVDHIYMTAVQIEQQSGGWPLSAFLTAEGKPFFTGTYFPPQSFSELLARVDFAWMTQHDGIVNYAEQLSDAVEEYMSVSQAGEAVLDDAFIETTVNRILSNYDPLLGGFSNAPKFPNEPVISLLLEIARSDHPMAGPALNAVENTLANIQAGGIHDHAAGGFHRYSTDAQWLVPHFEKMLYNQSQLGTLYVQAYELTGREDFKRTATRIYDYVLREMTSPDGGFYSATDADNIAANGEMEEGEYFTWTIDDVRDLLDPQDAERAIALFNMTLAGNFEHRNILTLPVMATAQDRQDADRLLQALYDARQSRNAPLLDDKVIVGWNGPMILAMAEAGRAFDDPRYTQAATKAAQWITQVNYHDQADNVVKRINLQGEVGSIPGQLDDYAALILANLAVYDEQRDPELLADMVRLKNQMIALFQDTDTKSFYMTAGTPAGLLTRPREFYDGAQPSGNSLALQALVELWKRTGDLTDKSHADQVWAALSGNVSQSPRAYAAAAQAGLQLVRPSAATHTYVGGGKVKLSASRDDQRFAVSFDIAEGWHINAERLRQKDLIPTSIGGEDVTRLRWPRAKNYDAKYAELYGGGAIRIFNEQFEVNGRITGQGSRLVNVRLQPCNDEICLAPETVSLLVPAQ